MIDRLFPKQFDNVFRGLWPGLWLFAPVVLVELAMGVNTVFNTRFVATSADGIPLDRFDAGGADAVLALFALTGLFRLLLALQGLLVLVRYRAMIPLMYLLLLVLHLGSKALLAAHPIARSGAASAEAGSALIFAILAALVAGLVLSLIKRPGSPEPTG